MNTAQAKDPKPKVHYIDIKDDVKFQEAVKAVCEVLDLAENYG
jgi:hypothetical protein